MATGNQAALIAACVQDGIKANAAETDKGKFRSAVDSYVVDILKKNWKQHELDSLGAMDIQDAMNLAGVPRPANQSATGPSGVSETLNPAYVTKEDFNALMDQNQKLLDAMAKMIAAQNAPAPTTPTP